MSRKLLDGAFDDFMYDIDITTYDPVRKVHDDEAKRNIDYAGITSRYNFMPDTLQTTGDNPVEETYQESLQRKQSHETRDQHGGTPRVTLKDNNGPLEDMDDHYLSSSSAGSLQTAGLFQPLNLSHIESRSKPYPYAPPSSNARNSPPPSINSKASVTSNEPIPFVSEEPRSIQMYNYGASVPDTVMETRSPSSSTALFTPPTQSSVSISQNVGKGVLVNAMLPNYQIRSDTGDQETQQQCSQSSTRQLPDYSPKRAHSELDGRNTLPESQQPLASSAAERESQRQSLHNQRRHAPSIESVPDEDIRGMTWGEYLKRHQQKSSGSKRATEYSH